MFRDGGGGTSSGGYFTLMQRKNTLESHSLYLKVNSRQKLEYFHQSISDYSVLSL